MTWLCTRKRSLRSTLTWASASQAWPPMLASSPSSCATPAWTIPTSMDRSIPVSVWSLSLVRSRKPRRAIHLRDPSEWASSWAQSIRLVLTCSKRAHLATSLSTFPWPLVTNASLQRPILRSITLPSVVAMVTLSSHMESRLCARVQLRQSWMRTTSQLVLWDVDKTSVNFPKKKFVPFLLVLAAKSRCKSIELSTYILPL